MKGFVSGFKKKMGISASKEKAGGGGGGGRGGGGGSAQEPPLPSVDEDETTMTESSRRRAAPQTPSFKEKLIVAEQKSKSAAAVQSRRRSDSVIPTDGLMALGSATRGSGMGGLDGVGEGEEGEEEEEEETTLHLPDDSTRPAALAARTDATRLRNVFAAPLVMDADWTAPVHAKSDDDRAFIRECLEGNFVFSNIDADQTETLVSAFESVRVPGGREVIRQGETGDYFYIIDRGTVSFLVNGRKVGQAYDGASFGELALLYDCPRAATCVVSSDGDSSPSCDLWRVDQTSFRKILASHTIKSDGRIRDILRQVPFLSDLDSRYISRIVEALTTYTYKSSDAIIRKGDEGNVFYVIKSGTVKVHDIEIGQSTYDDQQLGKGGYFGERAIVTKEKRVANVTAVTDCELLCLSRDEFLKILGNLSDLVLKTEDKRKLAAMPVFDKSNIKDYEIGTLADLIDERPFKAGHQFFKEGSVIRYEDLALYIVRDGKVSVSSSIGTVNQITQGGYFGDDNLRSSRDATVVADATAVAEENCTVGILTLHAVNSVLGLGRRLATSSAKNVANKLDKSVKMSDLKKHRILGVGTFGKVWLVSNKNNTSKNKEAFALKVQRKRELLDYNQVGGVIREKNIMASVDSPFIIKLVNVYQDDKCLYMLLRLVQGGELFSVLHNDRNDCVPERSAKFYAAGVFEGLSYFHKRHILYRDLKPENVLMDAQGYTVIVDLGFAKIVGDGEKTYTLCGTPLYLAPEVILSRGHDKGADHWSWAVLVYEMIVGVTPFYDHGIEQIELFKKIVQGRFVFPRGMMSKDVRDLVKGLLVVRPTNRLGSFARGDLDIREHTWFDGFDFEALRQKKMAAPWKPKIKSPLDASHFDNWDHMDTPEPKGGALSKNEQEKFKDF